jgi:hypothetical protein
MMRYLMVYLLAGCVFTGQHAAWREKHCPPPNELSLVDSVGLIVFWGLLIPTAVVYGVLSERRERICNLPSEEK